MDFAVTDNTPKDQGARSMSGEQSRLSKEKLQAADNALAFLDAFRKIRPTMPLQHAYTFMLVARQEGLGVLEYAEQAGVAQSVMTRHLLDIGPKTRTREPGYGLVEQRMDPEDMRKHKTYLTALGRSLFATVIRTMGVR